MRAILIIFLSFIAYSKADSVIYLPSDSMAQKSDAIAIVTVGLPERGKFIGNRMFPMDSKATRKTFYRRSAADVDEIIKGKLPQKIFVFDSSGHWDVLFQEGPGKYLLFLRGKPDFMTGTNGWFSSRFIKDSSVYWAIPHSLAVV